MTDIPASIDATVTMLRDGGYVPDRALATVLYLSLKMGRPLFLEGEAGVGKTEIAKVLADRLGRKLIRLQCYEGLDIASAVYEWNYAAQMIEIRAAEAAGTVDRDRLVHDVFAERFLIRRPLLQALADEPGGAPVLLIDELDRADEAFEAYLLEVLADNQVTIPELGTIRAATPPIVVVTTNRTREIHDALKRRCLYHWIDYPGLRARTRDREGESTRRRRPSVEGDRRLRAKTPRRGSVQESGRRRNARLGDGVDRTRPGGARSGDGRRHARGSPQIPGRHRPARRVADAGDPRRGPRRLEPGGMSDGRLADNILLFARALRRAGLPVGPAAVLDAIRAAELAGLGAREDFYWALHAVFVKRHDQHAVFDEAFRLFWRTRAQFDRMFDGMGGERERVAPPPPAARRAVEAMFEGLGGKAPRRIEVETDARLSASDREALRRRDFAQMTAAEIAEAERQIERLRLPDDRVRTRRSLGAPPPGSIDPRRTMRASLRTGGDMILLRHREPREVHPPIVILCDISGSMSAYSRVFLHFAHALGQERRVATFLFGTRLTNVTRQLRRRDPDAALAACSDVVRDWSGGTRIGAALHDFNRKWSRRVLGQGAVVLLVTDGLERDGVETLSREIDILHRSCRRLIWLNPLLGYDAFEAKAGGIRAMLPHVDEFRAGHSLDAVADLVRALGGEGGRLADPRHWLRAA